MIKVLLYLKRKDGLSREAFIDYYETRHVPLIMGHFGRFYLDYRRSYPEGPPFGLAGLPEGAKSPGPFLDYDVLTEIWLKDRATADAMFAAAAEPAVAAEVAADEEKFVDRAAVRIQFAEEYPRR